MNNYRKAMTDWIEDNIIRYLENQDPSKHYNTHINVKNQGRNTALTAIVKEKGIFGEKICTITTYSVFAAPIFQSNNYRVLPQIELEKLTQGAEIEDILFFVKMTENFIHHN